MERRPRSWCSRRSRRTGTCAGLTTPAVPFSQDATTTVQIINDLGFCWGAEYSTNINNENGLFKAKAD